MDGGGSNENNPRFAKLTGGNIQEYIKASGSQVRQVGPGDQNLVIVSGDDPDTMINMITDPGTEEKSGVKHDFLPFRVPEVDNAGSVSILGRDPENPGAHNLLVSSSIHQPSTREALHYLRVHRMFSDVSFVCKKRSFGAHKIILIMHSTYFKSLIVDHRESKIENHPISFLVEFDSPRRIEMILEYIYNGHVVLSEGEVKDLIEAAVQYEVVTLIPVLKQQFPEHAELFQREEERHKAKRSGVAIDDDYVRDPTTSRPLPDVPDLPQPFGEEEPEVSIQMIPKPPSRPSSNGTSSSGSGEGGKTKSGRKKSHPKKIIQHRPTSLTPPEFAHDSSYERSTTLSHDSMPSSVSPPEPEAHQDQDQHFSRPTAATDNDNAYKGKGGKRKRTDMTQLPALPPTGNLNMITNANHPAAASMAAAAMLANPTPSTSAAADAQAALIQQMWLGQNLPLMHAAALSQRTASEGGSTSMSSSARDCDSERDDRVTQFTRPRPALPLQQTMGMSDMAEKLQKAFLAASMGQVQNPATASPPTVPTTSASAAAAAYSHWVSQQQAALAAAAAAASSGSTTSPMAAAAQAAQAAQAARGPSASASSSPSGTGSMTMLPTMAGPSSLASPRPSTSGRGRQSTGSIGSNGKQSVRCEVCGKTLADPSSLYRHRKIHSGDKPHECKWCGRRFIQRYNMTQHIKTHFKSRGINSLSNMGHMREEFMNMNREGSPSMVAAANALQGLAAGGAGVDAQAQAYPEGQDQEGQLVNPEDNDNNHYEGEEEDEDEGRLQVVEGEEEEEDINPVE